MELDRKDIQGLVVSSYKHLPCAAFLLLRIADAGRARSWLTALTREITASEGRQGDSSTNVALTWTGLKNLGLSQTVLSTFSLPFQEGMGTNHRSRILGDTDGNAPSNWDWGGNATSQVDLLLLLYGKDENVLKAQFLAKREQLAANGGLAEVAVLEAHRQPDSHEHFGFNDGIGQPVMEGTGNKDRQLKRTHHATELPAGEFLMGHPNVYGVIADGPVVSAGADSGNYLVPIQTEAGRLNVTPGMHDLALNGTYLVLRQLAQDVAKFWNFLDTATRAGNGGSDAVARERLGAKFVGRWQSGAPLVLSAQQDNPALMNENNFDYLATDRQGTACPVGAHIRRSNPRDSLGPDAPTALTSANRHRILRRGRSYGKRIADPMVDDGAKRGLIFICLNSDIERQFEFVQQTWLNNPVFGGLDAEVDPLVGNLAKGDCVYTVQSQPMRSRVHNLERFVSVKGGAYFFLPSIRGLRYLASLDSATSAGKSSP